MYNPFAVLQQLQPDGGSVRNATQFFGTPPVQKKPRKPRPSQAKKGWVNNILGDNGITRVGDTKADSAKRAREDAEGAAELFFDAVEDTDMDGTGIRQGCQRGGGQLVWAHGGALRRHARCGCKL